MDSDYVQRELEKNVQCLCLLGAVGNVALVMIFVKDGRIIVGGNVYM